MIKIIIGILLVFMLYADTYAFNISVTHKQHYGSRSMLITFAYHFTSNSCQTQIISSNGVFKAYGRDIKYINKVLRVPADTADTLSENITLSNSFINRLNRDKISTITYERAFRCSSHTLSYLSFYHVSALINIKKPAEHPYNNTPLSANHTAKQKIIVKKIDLTSLNHREHGKDKSSHPMRKRLIIKKTDLFFLNRKKYVVVKNTRSNLNIYASIKCSGSGRLSGYWKCDGRKTKEFQKMTDCRKSITIPYGINLLNEKEGRHTVSIVIKNAETKEQKISYTIADKIIIKVTRPANNGGIRKIPVIFSWKSSKPLYRYKLEVFNNPSDEPVFYAYTINNSYTMKNETARAIFKSSHIYSLKITGLKKSGSKAAESRSIRFKFNIDTNYVPRVVLTAVKKNAYTQYLINKIKNKYKLTVLNRVYIKYLNAEIVKFHTQGNAYSTAKLISSEKGVIVSQVNHIFQTKAEPLSGIQRIDDMFGFLKLHRYLTGKGIKVAIIDTGVDINHKDIKDRVVYHKNFLSTPYKGEIHGSAVAGIIAAGINKKGIEGIAPYADILAFRACEQIRRDSPKGNCFSFSILKAINEAIHQKADIVNMSFGAKNRDILIDLLINEGVKKDIFFVAPSGNNPEQNSLDFPASGKNVISAAGVDQHNSYYPNIRIAEQSNFSAPVKNIFTTYPDNRYNFISGTSISSAIVSGIIALMLENKRNLNMHLLLNAHKNLIKFFNFTLIKRIDMNK